MHTNATELTPGKWYCIGFELFSLVDEPRMDWGQILRYEGPNDWYDEDNNRVESLWDPELQMPVALDAADAYACQS
jgi:hypothetical protein